jgi:hypothetical protein
MIPFSASSNEYKELSLSRKAAISDLVVIGRVTRVDGDGCLDMYKCAYLEMSSVLKGTPSKSFPVLFDGPIAEEESDCCEKGKTYLFFLVRVRGTYYASSNGPYGIYGIP